MERRGVKLFIGTFLVVLLLCICGTGLGETSLFFKEHMSITPWAWMPGSGWYWVRTIHPYSQPSASILYKKSAVQQPVEVVGAVKNSYDNIWFVGKDGSYYWSGYKWQNNKFVKDEDDHDTCLDFRLKSANDLSNVQSTVKLNYKTIAKGSSVNLLSGTITSDTAISGAKIGITPQTSGASNPDDIYIGGKLNSGNYLNDTSFFNTTNLIITTKYGGMTFFDTAQLKYGTYTVRVWVTYGVTTFKNELVLEDTFQVVDGSTYPSSVNAQSLTLKKGTTGQMKATVSPNNAGYNSITWSEVSDSSNCITITSGGKVTANKAGKATVKATVTWTDNVTGSSMSISGNTTVTVYEPSVGVTGIDLDTYQLDFVENNSYTLYATVTPSSASNKTLAWSSSNTNVATVDQSGTVTPQGNGSAYIYAESTDGSYVRATCRVNVQTRSNPTNLTLNQWTTASINVAGASAYFKFTPATSGNYVFYSKTDELADTYAMMYDSNWQILQCSEQRLKTGFSMICELEAGQTYYFGTGFNDDVITSSFTVRITDDISDEKIAFHNSIYFTADDVIKKHGYLTVTAHLPENLSSDFTNTYDNGSFRACFYNVSTGEQSDHTSGSHGGNLFYDANNASIEWRKIDNHTYQLISLEASLITQPGEHILHIVSNNSSGIILFSTDIYFTVLDTEVPANPGITFTQDSYAYSDIWGTVNSDEVEELAARISGYYLTEHDGTIHREGRKFWIDLSWKGAPTGNKQIGFLVKINGAWSEIAIYTVLLRYNGVGFNYSLDSNGYATITKYTWNGGDIVVPSTIDGHPVKAIGDRAFQMREDYRYSNDITSVIIEEGITSIGANAFDHCWGLKSVSIPASVTQIGEGAFRGCYNLETITVAAGNNSFTAVDNRILYNKAKTRLLTCALNGADFYTITLPDTLQTIDAYATEYGNFILANDLPASLTRIGDLGLSGANWPQGYAYIPANLTSLGKGAIDGKADYIEVDPNNPVYASEDGALYNKDKTWLLAYPNGRTDSYYQVPDGVIGIGDRAITCSWLNRLIIADSVKWIGAENLSGTGLTYLQLPEQLLTIGDRSFSTLWRLKNVRVPEGVTHIGKDVFCTSGELTIHGAAGSLAEEYARDNFIPFEPYTTGPTGLTIFGDTVRPYEDSTLTAYVDPWDASIRAYWFEPIDNEYVRLQEDGTIMGRRPGQLYVYAHAAEDPTVTAEYLVRVEPIFSVSAEATADMTGNVDITLNGHAPYSVPFFGTQMSLNVIGENWELINVQYSDAMGGSKEIDVRTFLNPNTGKFTIWFQSLDGTNTLDIQDMQITLRFRIPQDSQYWGQTITTQLNDYNNLLICNYTDDNMDWSYVYDNPDDVTLPSAVTIAVPDRPMTHAEFMQAPIGSSVYVDTYVQAWEDWWDNKINLYTQSRDGGYFIYNLECPEDYAATYLNTRGNKILVRGTKAEFNGEIEIIDAVTEYIAGDSYIAPVADVTGLIGTDALAQHMNEHVFFDEMTIVPYDDSGAAFAYQDPTAQTGDLYFKASRNGTICSFTVRNYFCNADANIRSMAENLNVGDVVTCEGFLYWNSDPTTIVTKLIKTSGKCGPEARWEYANGVLTISGSGVMEEYDYWAPERPWDRYTDDITSIVIGQGITGISQNAFCEFESLTSVELPEGLKTIGHKAFRYTPYLESIVLPDSLENIGKMAFLDSGLTQVTIPRNVQTIDRYAFADTPLTGIDVAAENEYFCSVEGVIFTKDSGVLIFYPTGKEGASYTLPEGTTAIGEYAFFGSSEITELILPKTLTTIGDHAISNCLNLTAIFIPDSVIQFGEAILFNMGDAKIVCFEDSAAYTYAVASGIPYEIIAKTPMNAADFVIPAGVTAIEAEAFYGINAKMVRLPEGVESIGSKAFSQCTELVGIYIPDHCENIANDAFDEGRQLTIYGKANSWAQYYAGRHGFTFVPVE